MPEPLDQTLAALADPTRRRVVNLLREQPQRSSHLADALSVSRPAMSRHLRVLRKAGVVEERSLDDDARGRLYELRRAPFTELKSWLEEVEAFWDDQLAAFKAHVETKERRRRR